MGPGLIKACENGVCGNGVGQRRLWKTLGISLDTLQRQTWLAGLRIYRLASPLETSIYFGDFPASHV